MLVLKPHAKGIYEPPGISCQSIGLAKKFIWVFHYISGKKPKELFDQPNSQLGWPTMPES